MVQPSKPPISIRFPDDVLAEVDAYAAGHGLARNAALLALVKRGLAPDAPKPVPKPQALPDVRAKAPIPPKASASSVPFAGDVQRKPYQKGQKR